MSQEIAIMAIIQPAPGKLDRIKDLLVDAIKWIEANEPETLEFSFYEQTDDKGVVKLSMFERYASKAAMEKHESSESYQKFFKTMAEEELLTGEPVITKGKHCYALRR